MKKDKILVCITVQSNSKRLIDKGHLLAEELAGELHILHVKKGDNIFDNEDTPKLLNELFIYATCFNGMVHVQCEDDVIKSIKTFILDNAVTKLVIGAINGLEPEENMFIKTMKEAFDFLEIIVLP